MKKYTKPELERVAIEAEVITSGSVGDEQVYAGTDREDTDF